MHRSKRTEHVPFSQGTDSVLFRFAPLVSCPVNALVFFCPSKGSSALFWGGGREER